jgi:hypothetical protein
VKSNCQPTDIFEKCLKIETGITEYNGNSQTKVNKYIQLAPVELKKIQAQQEESEIPWGEE